MWAELVALLTVDTDVPAGRGGFARAGWWRYVYAIGRNFEGDERSPVLSLKTLIPTASLMMVLSTSLVSAQDGKTIFGDNKKGTLKAMKAIVKSIGVAKEGACLYCHIKEGGKPNFAADSPRKQIARLMKTNFVDKLASEKNVSVALNDEAHKMNIVAEYKSEGEKPGIYLTATTASADAKTPLKTYETVVPLPAKGQTVTCMTCHNEELHFMTGDH